MQTRTFALVAGVIYLVVGIIAFIPALRSSYPVTAEHLDVSTAQGLLFGLFPVNLIHNLGNILIGLLGLLAYIRESWSINYSKLLFLLFGLVTVFGFVPQSDVLWGWSPLWSPDTWASAITAILGGYFGWVAPAETHVPGVEAHAH